MDPKYLILGPGGMGFYAMLGACSSMWSQIKNIDEISGASAGAILGLFLGMGMTPSRICELTMDIDLKELATYNIRTFLDNYGLIDHTPIREKLVSICGGNPTFSSLSKKVYVSAFNVNLGKTEYFSVDTHPDMYVIDAVCMSLSVPFLFSSYVYKDYLYIDGGVMEQFPGSPFLGKSQEEVLVIRLLTSPYSEDINNFRQFVNALVIATLRNSQQTYKGLFKTVDLDISNVNVFDFNMSHEERLKLFLMFNYNK
jgi:predicted acylesterase/phospholipase RssA